MTKMAISRSPALFVRVFRFRKVLVAPPAVLATLTTWPAATVGAVGNAITRSLRHQLSGLR